MRIEQFLIDLAVAILVTCAVFGIKYLIWGKVVPNKVEKNRWIISVGLFLVVFLLSCLFAGAVPEGYSIAVLVLMVVAVQDALKIPKRLPAAKITGEVEKPPTTDSKIAAKKTIVRPFLIIGGVVILMGILVFLVSIFSRPTPTPSVLSYTPPAQTVSTPPAQSLSATPPAPVWKPCQPDQKLQILESKTETYNANSATVPPGYLRLYGILKNPSSNCIAHAISVGPSISDGTTTLQTVDAIFSITSTMTSQQVYDCLYLQGDGKNLCGLTIDPVNTGESNTGQFDIQFKVYDTLLDKSQAPYSESLRSGLKVNFNVIPVWVQWPK